MFDLAVFAIVKKHIDKLDYYALLAGGAPADEFDLESLEISKAIHADSSVLEIAEIIAQVFEKNFDEADSVNSFMQTAFNIKEELKQ